MADSKDFVVYCANEDTIRIASKIIDVTNINLPDQGDLKIGHLDKRRWQDGEANHMFHSWEKIRDRHVIFFCTARNEADEAQLYHFVCGLKQYGAASITVIMPFMIYRRQDRIEDRKINRNLNLLRLLKAGGANRIILCDIHSMKTLENAKEVGLEAINVDPTPAYKKALTSIMAKAKESGDRVMAYSPDLGSISRTVTLARELDIPVMLNLKSRDTTGQAHIVEASPEDQALLERLRQEHNFLDINFSDESIRGVIAIMREDEANTCGTARKTGILLRKLGAKDVYLCATHPVLSNEWKEKLIDDSPFTYCFFGNTIKRSYDDTTGGFIHEVDMSLVIGHELARLIEAL